MPAEVPARRAAARWLSVGMELDPGPLAPRVARAFLRDILAVWDCDDDDEVAAVLTSEVVTNAVRFAASQVTLRLVLRGDLLRVEARDDGGGMPRVLPTNVDAVSGRGLLLVQELARAWGAESAEGGGKVVWFEVPVNRRVSGDGTRVAKRSAAPPPEVSPPGAPRGAPSPDPV